MAGLLSLDEWHVRRFVPIYCINVQRINYDVYCINVSMTREAVCYVWKRSMLPSP